MNKLYLMHHVAWAMGILQKNNTKLSLTLSADKTSSSHFQQELESLSVTLSYLLSSIFSVPATNQTRVCIIVL